MLYHLCFKSIVDITKSEVLKKSAYKNIKTAEV